MVPAAVAAVRRAADKDYDGTPIRANYTGITVSTPQVGSPMVAQFLQAKRWLDSHAPSCLVSPSGAPVTNPMKGVSGTMGGLG